MERGNDEKGDDDDDNDKNNNLVVLVYDQLYLLQYAKGCNRDRNIIITITTKNKSCQQSRYGLRNDKNCLLETTKE